MQANKNNSTLYWQKNWSDFLLEKCWSQLWICQRMLYIFRFDIRVTQHKTYSSLSPLYQIAITLFNLILADPTFASVQYFPPRLDCNRQIWSSAVISWLYLSSDAIIFLYLSSAIISYLYLSSGVINFLYLSSAGINFLTSHLLSSVVFICDLLLSVVFIWHLLSSIFFDFEYYLLSSIVFICNLLLSFVSICHLMSLISFTCHHLSSNLTNFLYLIICCHQFSLSVICCHQFSLSIICCHQLS